MSGLLPLEAGVPQGSILGPIFYTIFTNELPQLVHKVNCPTTCLPGASIFTIHCQECGSLCCYADDSTITVTARSPAQLTDKLSAKYNAVADFLTDNKLKVNDDKTHLLVMTTRQKRRFIDTNSTSIHTPTETVYPSITEKLLGAEIHQDMKWGEHILLGENSLVKSLNKRLGALKKVQNIASFKSRKMIGTGIFMSKLIYLMPLWAGCEEYLVKALQVIQNKAARSIAKLTIFTPTKKLLKTCDWMSVRQLMTYHSLVLLHKTLSDKSPVYLHQKVTAAGQFPYRTRQAARSPTDFSFEVQHPTAIGIVRQVPGAKLDIIKKGWCFRSVETYNTLPPSLRLENKLPKFKKDLKSWVETHIDI